MTDRALAPGALAVFGAGSVFSFQIARAMT